MKSILSLIIASAISYLSFAQVTVNVYLDSIKTQITSQQNLGVYYVPKTIEAQDDFLNNGIQQNAIRTSIIESALNNSTNLNDCITYLDDVSNVLQELSLKSDKLIFVIEKMPAWLSSSSDGSPAATPGWFVLNTKPPANYTNWNIAISTIINQIINTYSISNAYFEIWNEPDLGSWTGTEDEFFTLFKNTYDAIKSVNATIPVGGPASNNWGNHIYNQPPFGYLNNQLADQSLLGELIDSSMAWNRPLDFISWHNFNLTFRNNQNAVEYITQKYAAANQTLPELIVSEWNTPFIIRETPLQKAFFLKNKMVLTDLPIDNHMVAAWQDFNESADEFHNDYGMLTYGSIHKPVYKGLLLWNQLKGNILKHTSTEPVDIMATRHQDTLNILITNYIPPAFVGAFNHTLFEGKLNAQQLDSIGYINIANNNFDVLESIYNGNITLPNNNPINIAVNNSISTYTLLEGLQNTPRVFNFNINTLMESYTGINYTINDTINNSHFQYDELLSQGLTSQEAIANIVTDQSLNSTPVNITNGEFNFSIQPNAIQLFQFIIDTDTNVEDVVNKNEISIFPNPTNHLLQIKSEERIGKIGIYDLTGRELIQEFDASNNTFTIDLDGYASGIYLIKLIDWNKIFKVVKR